MNNISTPAFVFDLAKMHENIIKIQDALSVLPNSKLLYSVKSNSLPIIIKSLRRKKIDMECVSLEEYDYLTKMNINLKNVVVNGPLKTNEFLEKIVRNNSYINIDSLEEYYRLKNLLLEKKAKYEKIGVRINIPFSKKNMNELIGYDNSRFGVSEEDFLVIIEDMKKSNLVLQGLHFHINHNYKLEEDYTILTEYVCYLIKKCNLNLKYIDFGGGILRGIESINFKSILRKCSAVYKKNNIDIRKILFMFEPGAALVGNIASLYSTVVSKKIVNNVYYLTVDVSKNYFDITRNFSEWNHIVVNSSSSKIINDEQVVCGFTCMESDRLFKITNRYEINIGDTIVFEKVGTYSTNLIPFFINGIPKIYVSDMNGVKRLKQNNITLGDFYEKK